MFYRINLIGIVIFPDFDARDTFKTSWDRGNEKTEKVVKSSKNTCL